MTPRPLIEWPLMNDAPVAGHEKDDEAFLMYLLKSLGFDCGDEAKWGYSEQRYFVLNGCESIVVLDPDDVTFRVLCHGPGGIKESQGRLAENLVKKLNGHSTDIQYRFDFDCIWCECSSSVNSLRQMKSRTEQRGKLSWMLTAAANGIRSNNAAIGSLETESD